MKVKLGKIVLISVAAVASSVIAADDDPLYSPGFFWMWNDRLEPAELCAQLEDMRSHGLRNVCAHPFPKSFRTGSFSTRMEPDYLTPEFLKIYAAVAKKARELGMKNIRPNSDHRSSNITAVFVCDSVHPDAAKALEKTRDHKDFLFSFHGWMDFRAVAVDLATGGVAVNRAAKDMKEFIRGNLEKCQLN